MNKLKTRMRDTGRDVENDSANAGGSPFDNCLDAIKQLYPDAGEAIGDGLSVLYSAMSADLDRGGLEFATEVAAYIHWRLDKNPRALRQIVCRIRCEEARDLVAAIEETRGELPVPRTNNSAECLGRSRDQKAARAKRMDIRAA